MIAKAERMSVSEIAEYLTQETEQDSRSKEKVLRAYLRSNHSRSIEKKNSRWGEAKNQYRLSKTLTKSILDHFDKSEQEQESK